MNQILSVHIAADGPKANSIEPETRETPWTLIKSTVGKAHITFGQLSGRTHATSQGAFHMAYGQCQP